MVASAPISCPIPMALFLVRTITSRVGLWPPGRRLYVPSPALSSGEIGSSGAQVVVLKGSSTAVAGSGKGVMDVSEKHALVIWLASPSRK